jgi:mono/diheme cytochrome c family protein
MSRIAQALFGARTLAGLAGTAAALLLLSACDDAVLNMRDQPRQERYEGSEFFHGSSARPRVPGTVARDESGPEPRPELTLALLERGRERFDIYCSVCHGRTGDGHGMVVQRGFPQPPSLHDETIVDRPDEHYFNVMTNGLGKMPSYSNQVNEHDRWAIAAYIRALQVSRTATLDDVPPEQRPALEEETEPQ